MKLIEALPGIIEASVKPMAHIDSIKIMKVDGLNRTATTILATRPTPHPAATWPNKPSLPP